MLNDGYTLIYFVATFCILTYAASIPGAFREVTTKVEKKAEVIPESAGAPPFASAQ